MPTRESYAEGTPSFTDVSTPDPAGAQTFYGAVFGWEFEENPTDQGPPYVMATKGGKNVAGVMQQPQEQADMGIPSMWNTYLAVTDIAATVAKVPDAGGSVMMPPMDVMDAGKMAVIVDPGGAVVCLWQAGEHIGSELVNEHGAVIWNEMISPDVAAATDFFGKLVGWTTEDVDMGEIGTYTVFNVNGEPVGGGMAPPMEGMPAHWLTYFCVDDCDAMVEAVTANGGSVLMEPMDSPPGRIATVADPFGAAFALMTPSETPS